MKRFGRCTNQRSRVYLLGGGMAALVFILVCTAVAYPVFQGEVDSIADLR
jgi:hypothetical protein